MFNDPTKNFPGPGSYNGNLASENKGGHYVSSRYKSPGNPVISRQGKRFEDHDERRTMAIPGPGQYQAIPDKVWRNYGVAVIGSSKRSDLSDPQKKSKQTPMILTFQNSQGLGNTVLKVNSGSMTRMRLPSLELRRSDV